MNWSKRRLFMPRSYRVSYAIVPRRIVLDANARGDRYEWLIVKPPCGGGRRNGLVGISEQLPARGER